MVSGRAGRYPVHCSATKPRISALRVRSRPDWSAPEPEPRGRPMVKTHRGDMCQDRQGLTTFALTYWNGQAVES
jgi:hypothetical protein